MDNKEVQAIQVANNIISNLLAVKPGEEVLICIDPETDTRMSNAMAAAAERCGADYTIAMMPVRGADKATTIPKPIEKAMEAADVYIGMTKASGASVYNTKMKELLLKKKIRESSMVLRNLDNYTKGGALADYEAVYADGVALSKIWKDKKVCKITSEAGTNLTFDMISEAPIIECGIARNPGESMAFSDGEVSVGPVEGTMNGIMVLDGPMCYYGQPTEPIKLKIEAGKVVEIISGDKKISGELKKLFATVPNSDNIAEIGIGLNPASLFNGDFEEEKKARGTVHFALGNGIYYGQTVDSQVHIDMVVYNTNVTFDDMVILEKGKVVCLGDK